MILPILIGTNLFLYLAGLYVFNEYMATLDEIDLRETGLIPLPPALRIGAVLLWPVFVFAATLHKAKQ